MRNAAAEVEKKKKKNTERKLGQYLLCIIHGVWIAFIYTCSQGA